MSSARTLLLALSPEILLTLGAIGLLLFTVARPQGNNPAVAEGAERTGTVARLGIALTIVVALLCVWSWYAGAPGTDDQRIAGDGLRWGIDIIVLTGSALTLLLLDADHRRNGAYSPEVPVLILLATVGAMVLAAARDMMFVFLGVELMSIAVYVLAGVNRRSARGAEAAMKYFLLGSFSTGFLLYGMALVYGASGSTRLADIGAWAASQPELSVIFLLGIGMLLVGFAFKVAAAPFHLWTPDVYDGSPLPVAGFMAAAVKTAAFASFARVMFEALGATNSHWHPLIWWGAAITMVIGNVMALAQRNVVRMLAYSSIAHAGYLLVALVANSAAGVTALLFYLVSYTLATMGAFAVLIAVNEGRDRAPTFDDLNGLWHVRPGLATAMAVFMLAFLGFPLLGGIGFFAKWYLLQALLQAGTPQRVLSVILVLTSVVSAGYYLGVVTAMFMRPREADRSTPTASGMTRVLITATAVAIIVFGVYPTPIVRLARQAAATTPMATR